MANHLSPPWPSQDIPAVLTLLKTSEHGLSEAEASHRLAEYGANKLPAASVDTLPKIFLRQFQSPLIYILLISGLILFILGEKVDGWIILAILLFNATVGTIQEGKAQNTLLALEKFVETRATVLRDGKEMIISDTEVVPGDIVMLAEGEKIPADGRIIASHNLKIDEAAMTGESIPVQKMEATLKFDASTGIDRKNMVFKGTNIVSGNGRAVIVGTGLETVIGRIAKQITIINTETPLQGDIRYLSRLIIIVVIAICSGLFLWGLLLGKAAIEMFGIVVSLAVSIVPEGLPIVVTLILATGVWRMSKRQALVKKLQAVDALGQARVIAVDKTGTITKNELVIQKVFVDGRLFEVEGVGYEPKGEIRLDGKLVDALSQPGLALAGKAASYCSSARVMFSEEESLWRVAGDPTEAALLVFAHKLDFHKERLEEVEPILAEIPFDYRLKYHAVVYGAGAGRVLSLVGAPEIILALSSKIWRDGQRKSLGEAERRDLETIFARLSRAGLRVVACASATEVPGELLPEKINNLDFIGFYAMKDALRPEVAEAMAKAKAAGIRVVMITGDHKITAQAIAREAGIYNDGDNLLTGTDIDALSEKELAGKLAKTSVFARVNPDHKLTIIKAFRARGEIVAMTGDGVNDAPSLVAADLGVAMGRIGTEVAKEAADIILLDDNFGSIVAAVEEGRNIYRTIKKVILYLFSTNAGEVITIIGALLLGYPMPIIAAHIIWLNFVTDSFLDVSLGMEPKETDLLQGGFAKPKKYLIDKVMAGRMILMALPMAIGTLWLFKDNYQADITRAWTISLTLLAAFQWFNAWNCRSETRSIFRMNPFKNKFLVGATLIVIGLQLLAVYHPALQKILRTTALAPADWLTILPIAASIVLVEEIRKFFARRLARQAN
ncbi:MAG: HAD-IC family P-type ATPase [Patescibacteria group bacterium]